MRLNPENDVAHYNLGAALGKKGDWGGEITEEHEALRLNPKNELALDNLVIAHIGRGLALEKKGDLDGAIAEYRKALRLNANDDMAHVNLGRALRYKGD